MTDLNNKSFIEKLNAHLVAGGVIAFPTDTVWGLGALPTLDGMNALFKIKNRPYEKSLILMSDTVDHIKPYMKDYPDIAFDLAKKYWPGALSIGMPITDDTLFASVRIPNHVVFQKLCNVINGNALATTSANISGKPVFTNADDIAVTFPDIIIIKDGGIPPAGLASTVAVISPDGTINIVRQGSVVVDL